MTKDEAMKLAREALELHGKQYPHMVKGYCLDAITALREALAEQPAQQEPVTWGVDWGKAGDISCVSIIKRLPDGRIEVVAVEYAPYSYTSPPAQRTWVGLTDEEKHEIRYSHMTSAEFIEFIEAKLKEKNT